jgi:hypothetical protein
MKSTAPARVVAIGDLNGSLETLLRILRGLRLVGRDDRWLARNTHLVQVGDLFNRGGGGRAALELLLALQKQAPDRKSRVSVLLGNHEVMTALGNEAYCTVEEYMSFATPAQRRAWPAKVNKAMRRIYGEHDVGGPIRPLAPRVEVWKIENAPGQAAMRRSLGAGGRLGRSLRKLPIVLKIGDSVFSHAPLTPRWARMGITGLNEATSLAWNAAPSFYRDLPRRGILSDTNGPLWNRRLVKSTSAQTRQQLAGSLRHLGAKRMIVGHTMTRHIKGGKDGVIKLRQRGRVVCIDVGLGRGNPGPSTALLIEDGAGYEWTPNQTRQLWR